MKSIHTLVTSALLLGLSPLHADWIVVDQFNDPALPGWSVFLPDPDEPRRVDPNDPPYIRAVADPFGGVGNVLEVYPGRLVELTSNMFASRLLPEEARIVDPFPAAGFATLYMRVARPLVGNRPAEVDTVWGLNPVLIDEMGNPRLDEEGNLVRPTTYGQFSVMARYEIDGIMDVRDESKSPQYNNLTATAHATDVWYELWYVINHGENTFRKYIRGGPEYPGVEPVLLYPFDSAAPPAQYRLKTFEDLAFFTIATSSGSVSDGAKGIDPTYFADLHIDPTGINLTTPASAGSTNPFAALVDGTWTNIANVGLNYGFQAGPGWSFHVDLGFIYSESFPWLYHQPRGWLFYQGGNYNAEGIYLYSPDLGWLFTAAAADGMLYVFNTGEWVTP